MKITYIFFSSTGRKMQAQHRPCYNSVAEEMLKWDNFQLITLYSIKGFVLVLLFSWESLKAMIVLVITGLFCCRAYCTVLLKDLYYNRRQSSPFWKIHLFQLTELLALKTIKDFLLSLFYWYSGWEKQGKEYLTILGSFKWTFGWKSVTYILIQ